MFRRSLLLNAPILIVEIFTILLISYIGYGEVNRKFPEFQLEKMTAQATTIRNAMDPILQAGIPINQFSGFNSFSEALIESDPFIKHILVVNNGGDVVFNKTGYNDSLDAQGVETSDLKVTIPLEGKFGTVGHIELLTDYSVVTSVVDANFELVVKSGVVIFVVFFIFVYCYSLFSGKLKKWSNKQKEIITIVYLVSFISIVTAVSLSAFSIYETGARAKTKALADTMAQRLDAVALLGIEFKDIDGIDTTFNEYRKDNPDISSVALSQNGISIFHTNTTEIGKSYNPFSDVFEYKVALKETIGSTMHLAVAIPKDIVIDAILERVKEFIVLFLACGLMSWVFLDAGTVLVQRSQKQSEQNNPDNVEQINGLASQGGDHNNEFELGLKLVKPAYFLIVFTSALPISFLPQLVTSIADAEASSLASGTLPFTIYYLIFAAILIPAGRYAEHGSLKKMMALGFITELIGLILIAFTEAYWPLVLGRVFSGFGQGLFLIGLNSYTLSITPKNKRTLGAAVKVNGRNAGLISGTAIGALLFAYMDYHGVFTIAAAISLVGMVYLWQLVPSVGQLVSASEPPVQQQGVNKDIDNNKENVTSKTKRSLSSDLIAVIRDAEFMRTLCLIGIIGKISIAGVMMFAIPLILSARGFPSEDIGQILMLYYVASIVVTRYVSRMVDYLGTSRNVLFFSAVVGGLGLILVGVVGANNVSTTGLSSYFTPFLVATEQFNLSVAQLNIDRIDTLLIIVGVILAGISNGLLAAPVMTHIDKTPVAASYGQKSVAASYLFLERGGHVVGPIIASQLLIFTQNTTLGIALFGLLTLILGGLFFISAKTN